MVLTAIFRRIFNWAGLVTNPETVPSAKLEQKLSQMFQPGNIVKRHAGGDYVVQHESRFPEVIVRSREDRKLYVIDMSTPQMQRLVENRWALVATPAQLAAELESWFKPA